MMVPGESSFAWSLLAAAGDAAASPGADALFRTLALGTVATGGCLLLLSAGQLERDGDAAGAVRRARWGGFIMFPGELLTVTLVALLPYARPESPAALLGVSAALLSAGLIGLLAGLSGKPRPSGHAAAVLHAAGLVALAAAG